MKSVADLLNALKQLQIKIWVDGDQIKIKGSKKKISPEILGGLKLFKPDLIRLLSKKSTVVQVPVKDKEPKSRYFLNAQQKSIWMQSQIEGDSANYHLTGVFKLEGDLDFDVLEKSFYKVMAQQDIFHSSFHVEDGEPYIKWKKDISFPFSRSTCSSLEEVKSQVLKKGSLPFDLRNGELLKVFTFSMVNKETYLMVSLHHIIADGLSLQIFSKQVMEVYYALTSGTDLGQPPIIPSFFDYLEDQNLRVASARYKETSQSYAASIKAYPYLLEIPSDFQRPSQRTLKGARVSFELGQLKKEKIKSYCAQHDLTEYQFYIGAYVLLLSKYSSQKKFLIGSPVVNRSASKYQEMVGSFANMKVLKFNLEDIDDLSDFYKNIYDECLVSLDEQDLSFQDLVDSLSPKRNLAYHPLFQVAFSYQRNPTNDFELPGLVVEEMKWDQESSMFDLSLVLEERSDDVHGFFEYSCDLFSSVTVENFRDSYVFILDQILDHPTSIAEISLLNDQQKKEILKHSSCLAISKESTSSVIGLFEKNVLAYPDSKAVVLEDSWIDYQECNDRANDLARKISALTDVNNPVIALCLERSIEQIIAIMAVMKIGGVFLPLDSKQPSARLDYMIKDSGAHVLIEKKGHNKKLDSSIVRLDVCLSDEILAQKNLLLSIPDDDCAYIIYTSGSTGHPKGVRVSYRTFRNMLLWYQKFCGLEHGVPMIQQIPYYFDASLKNSVGPLISGATLVLLPDGPYDPQLILDTLEKNKIEVWNLVPSSIYPVLEIAEKEDYKALSSVRQVSTGGESPDFSRLNNWLQASQGTLKVINVYGPSEGGDISTAYVWGDNSKEMPTRLPIGTSIDRVLTYVVDEDLKIQATNVAGELLVGGLGVAQAYINKPEVTSQKFILDPFKNDGVSRVYRTGDIVRRLVDGNIEFIGRSDNQIKIRGFRVELDEIEKNLDRSLAIKQSVVLHLKDSREVSRIVAFAQKDQEVSISDATLVTNLKNELSLVLPEYMIPDAFVFVESFSLTSNGKIDKKALKGISFEFDHSSDLVEEAQGPIEIIISDLWSMILGLEKVDRKRSFFEMGGQSILAAKAVARMNDALEGELSIKQFFAGSSIEECAKYYHLPSNVSTAVKKNLIDDSDDLIAPLSYSQKSLWFLHKMGDEKSTYNIHGCYEISGDLDEHLLEKSFEALCERHVILKTRFFEDNGDIKSEVVKDRKIDFIFETTMCSELEIQTKINQEAKREFSLEFDSLLSASVYKRSSGSLVLSVVMHHIISDGWSLGILVEDLLAYYQTGHFNNRPSLSIQYKDYAKWQNSFMKSDETESGVSYWIDNLQGVHQLSDLPLDFKRPKVQGFEGDQVSTILSKDFSLDIKEYCRNNKLTEFVFFISAYAILLQKYSRLKEFLIGVPLANRNILQTQDLIGFFVNTLPFKVAPSGDISIADFVSKIKEQSSDLLTYQDIPFDLIVERLNPERSMDRHPLFQIAFVMQNKDKGKLSSADLAFDVLEQPNSDAKFDLTLLVEEKEEGFELTFEFNKALFKKDRIQKQLGEYTNLLGELFKLSGEAKIREMKPFDYEQEKIFNDFSGKGKIQTVKGSILPDIQFWFQTQSKEIAIQSFEDQLTWEELNLASLQIASELIKTGLKKGDVVGVCMHAQVHFISVLLGIMRAGGIYMPLDPDYPDQRLAYMIERAHPKIIFYDSNMVCSENGIVWSDVIRSDIAIDVKEIEIKLPFINETDDAYLIFTSGSTGKPKGVLNSHKGLKNLVLNQIPFFKMTEESFALLFASFSFDASISEIFVALCGGAKLFVEDKKKYLGELFPEKMKELGITHVTLPPSLLMTHSVKDFPSLKTVVSAGEACNLDLVNEWSVKTRFINAYGPSEAAVCASMHLCAPDDQEISIGKTINNGEIQILDIHGSYASVEMPGEIYIGGESLSKGYFADSGLTDKSFGPFMLDRKKDRFYRTGDLASWSKDGNLIFLGRVDDQVKIRGYRIELGEIEAQLRSQKEIRDIVVFVEKEMILAFCITEENYEMEESQQSLLRKKWHDSLALYLPHYMMPHQYAFIDSFPLTPNGKIDRKALLTCVDIQEYDVEYTEPKNRSELLLQESFASVLGLETIGVTDNFFHKGGHSLLIFKLISRVKESLAWDLNLKDVFKYPSVRELASAFSNEKSNEENPFTVEICNDLIVNDAQRRLWFMESLNASDNSNDFAGSYNISSSLRIQGSLNIDALQKSFELLCDDHRILSSVYREESGEPYVGFKNDLDVFIEVDQSKRNNTPFLIDEELKLVSQFQFDLAKGPLFKVRLCKLGESDFILSIMMHHIISDGWSIGLILSEFSSHYRKFITKPELVLSDFSRKRSVDYFDYTAALESEYISSLFQKQISYWKETLKGSPDLLELPCDFPRPNVQSFKGDVVHLSTGEELKKRLASFTQKHGLTSYSTCISVFEILLKRYSGLEDILIGTPVANRRQQETEDMLGLFVNTVILRSLPEPGDTFVELAQKKQGQLIEVLENQDLPFERLVEELNPNRNLGFSPLFQVMFVMESGLIEKPALYDLLVEVLDLPQKSAKFDLTLFVCENEKGIEFSLEYNCSLFKPKRIERMLGHYLNLLEAMVSKSEEDYRTYDYLLKEEKLSFKKWNETDVVYDSSLCMFHLFEKQAEKTPGNIAIVDDQRYLTYEEVNDKANQLAHHLIGFNFKPESFVGISVDRSAEMIIYMIGIMKAGLAYIPLDPSYPQDRLSYMVADSKAEVLIVDEKYASAYEGVLETKVLISQDLFNRVSSLNRENPNLPLSSNTLSYVIYTSGSTGKPKGAMITHKGFVNYLLWAAKEYKAEQGSGSPVVSSFSFDATISSIFVPLIVGQKVLLMPEGSEMEELALAQYDRSNLTYLKITPSHLEILNSILKKDQFKNRTQALVIGGEALLGKSLVNWQSLAEDTWIINEYGPTETVVGCITHKFLSSEAKLGNVLIGKPIANTRIYLLDERNLQVPLGVAGEIFIAGDGLGRGYLHREELSAERFLTLKIDGVHERVYKTGDLAKFHEDGNVEYLGRIDQQVKIRAYRIELGEIETIIAAQDNILQISVIVQGEGANKSLAAYAVLDEEPESEELFFDDLRETLLTQLPDYMVPQDFMRLDEIPLTPNGKVNQKALPKILKAITVDNGPAAKTKMEELVVHALENILDIKGLNRNSHFFKVGGHSLLAAKLVSYLRDVCNKEIQLKQVFEFPIIKDLAVFLDSSKSLDTFDCALRKANERELSFAQNRMWMISQIDDNSTAYNVPLFYKMKGPVKIAALQYAIKEIWSKHEILRSYYPSLDGRPQFMISDKNASLEVLSPDQNKISFEEWINFNSQYVFNLDKGPLYRVSLFQVNSKEAYLCIVFHHIVTDAGSAEILWNELSELYESYGSFDTPRKSKKSEWEYTDFSFWQKEILLSSGVKKQKKYWKEQLENSPVCLDLPKDYLRPTEQKYQGDVHPFVLSEKVASLLGERCREFGVSPFVLLMGSFQLFLSLLSRSEDILVGTPVSNRSRKEFENVMGVFVNTLVIRAQVDQNLNFKAYIAEISNIIKNALANQDVPFEEIIESLQIERNVSHSPLFQVMFVYQNAIEPQNLGSELEVLPYAPPHKSSKFDLTLAIDHSRDNDKELLSGVWEYNTDLFAKNTIVSFGQVFETLLTSLFEKPQVPMKEISYLPSQTENILNSWNSTSVEFPKDLLIFEYFSKVANEHPERSALSFEGMDFSYSELDFKINQVSRLLLEKNVKKGDLVGVAMLRSMEMVLSLHAIMRIGAAYVPIDPAYPNQRIVDILDDGDIEVVLTQSDVREELIQKIELMPESLLALDKIDLINYTGSPLLDVAQIDLDDLAYVIYTSGSTGKPKGVMNTHRGILNRLLWMQAEYSLNSNDVVLQKTPYSFDVSVWEFFWPFMFGAKLCVAKPDGHQDVLYLKDLIIEEKVTTLHFVPSMLQVFLEEDVSDCQSVLKRVICSGEALSVHHKELFFTTYENVQLHNLYGPTEAAVDVTSYECFAEDESIEIPIGRPIANTQIHILDENLREVPIGVAGELHIGGENLARGYLNRKELSAEKFIVNPLSSYMSSRLYKTGDLARWTSDGLIEYLGRIDFQVKIRGLRIELGEIEACLLKTSYIKEVVVVVLEISNTQKQLVAYYVANDLLDLDKNQIESQLINDLKSQVPEYMMPNIFVPINEMPLSSNGKLDRKQLPVPELKIDEKVYQAPNTDIEIKLTSVFEQVLKVKNIGVLDNFFALGGDSILMIQIVARARKKGIVITPKLFFQHQNVRDLASVAKLVDSAKYSENNVVGSLRLNPIQEWFFQKDGVDFSYFNQSVVVDLDDSIEPLALQVAIQKLIKLHDALRLRFTYDHNRWTGVFLPIQEINSYFEEDFTSAPLAELSNDWDLMVSSYQASFDLEKGSLIKFVLVKTQEHNKLLIFAHHLIIDGVSWRILMDDLGALLQGDNDSFYHSASVQSWNDSLYSLTKRSIGNEIVEYWKSKISLENPEFPLSSSFQSSTKSSEKTHGMILSQNETKYLLTEMTEKYDARMIESLMTVFSETYFSWSGLTILRMDLEGHGREEILQEYDLTRSIGWFTSLYPVVIQQNEKDILKCIKGTKENLRTVPEKGFHYGVLKYLLKEINDFQSSPILFNYLGKIDLDVQENSLFAPASDPLGFEENPENKRDYIWNVSAYISEEKLHLNICYSSDLHTKEEIERFMILLKENFDLLFMKANEGNRGVYDAIDFEDVHLTDIDMEKLVGALGDQAFY